MGSKSLSRKLVVTFVVSSKERVVSVEYEDIEYKISRVCHALSHYQESGITM